MICSAIIWLATMWYEFLLKCIFKQITKGDKWNWRIWNTIATLFLSKFSASMFLWHKLIQCSFMNFEGKRQWWFFDKDRNAWVLIVLFVKAFASLPSTTSLLTTQRMKFSIKDFFNKCDQIGSHCWGQIRHFSYCFYLFLKEKATTQFINEHSSI